ncbi:MAG: ATP-binding protein [Pseudomonadales bacterium]|nr:ATP-binding protein [Pseudomonadales bacterium]
METGWQTMAHKAEQEGWSPQEFLAQLCDLEATHRYENKLKRLLKDSQLPRGKQLSQYDFDEIEGVKAHHIQKKMDNLDWVRQGHNVLIFGASGLGKTHLAAAIGFGLIEKSVKVKFIAATALAQQLQRSRESLSIEDALKKLDKYELLIVDDIGYVKPSDSEGQVLFELIAHRYERGSLIITSNQSFSDWDRIFGENMMTVAAIDRLVHHAEIIHIEGESFRKKQAVKSSN